MPALLSQTGRRHILCLRGHCSLGCPSVRAVFPLFSITHLPMRKRRKAFSVCACMHACVCVVCACASVCLCTCAACIWMCRGLAMNVHTEARGRCLVSLLGWMAMSQILPVFPSQSWDCRHLQAQVLFRWSWRFEFKFSCLLSKLFFFFYSGSLLPRPSHNNLEVPQNHFQRKTQYNILGGGAGLVVKTVTLVTEQRSSGGRIRDSRLATAT